MLPTHSTMVMLPYSRPYTDYTIVQYQAKPELFGAIERGEYADAVNTFFRRAAAMEPAAVVTVSTRRQHALMVYGKREDQLPVFVISVAEGTEGTLCALSVAAGSPAVIKNGAISVFMDQLNMNQLGLLCTYDHNLWPFPTLPMLFGKGNLETKLVTLDPPGYSDVLRVCRYHYRNDFTPTGFMVAPADAIEDLAKLKFMFRTIHVSSAEQLKAIGVETFETEGWVIKWRPKVMKPNRALKAIDASMLDRLAEDQGLQPKAVTSSLQRHAFSSYAVLTGLWAYSTGRGVEDDTDGTDDAVSEDSDATQDN